MGTPWILSYMFGQANTFLTNVTSRICDGVYDDFAFGLKPKGQK